jgi:hypothetical protein
MNSQDTLCDALEAFIREHEYGARIVRILVKINGSGEKKERWAND